MCQSGPFPSKSLPISLKEIARSSSARLYDLLTNSVLLHPIDEGAAADIEVTRSPGLISAGLLQRPQKQFTFDPLQAYAFFGDVEYEGGAGRRLARPAKLIGKILVGKLFAVRQDQHAFHEVLELANVSRPTIG